MRKAFDDVSDRAYMMQTLYDFNYINQKEREGIFKSNVQDAHQPLCFCVAPADTSHDSIETSPRLQFSTLPPNQRSKAPPYQVEDNWQRIFQRRSPELRSDSSCM
jgi:hypothetical protein